AEERHADSPDAAPGHGRSAGRSRSLPPPRPATPPTRRGSSMHHPLRALPLPALALLVLAACADRPGGPERPAPPPGASRAEVVASGAELYASYCASCHGASARGDGPAAASLEPPPSDLSTLAARWGRPLDRERLADFVDGRNAPRAHGPPGMPVWGERLYSG